jgi:NitT/TauT family transport system substrate-binding protein
VEKGFFKAEGLNVMLDRGSGSGVAIQRVVSGAYDFGYSDLGTLTKYAAENRARPVVAVYIPEDGSALALLSLEGKGIAKPKDVEGKRIGVSQFDGARLMFPVLAQANKLDVSGMSWKTVDAQLREMLLSRGEVDVITGFTTTSVPLLTQMKQKPVVIRYRDFGVDGFGQALVTTPAFAEKNPNTVRAFVRALNKAVLSMVEHPQDGLASLKARDPLVDMTAEAMRMDITIKELILTPHAVKYGISSADPKRLAATIADVLQVTEDKSPLAVEAVYTDRFLPPVAERMPRATR